MAVTSATLNGEINYRRCHLRWHRSQFDHVNQMIGPLDVRVLCNHALMERIKMRLGYLTVFIIRSCHWVTWTIKWLTRSHCHSLTLIKVIELRHLTWSTTGNSLLFKVGGSSCGKRPKFVRSKTENCQCVSSKIWCRVQHWFISRKLGESEPIHFRAALSLNFVDL